MLTTKKRKAISRGCPSNNALQYPPTEENMRHLAAIRYHDRLNWRRCLRRCRERLPLFKDHRARARYSQYCGNVAHFTVVPRTETSTFEGEEGTYRQRQRMESVNGLTYLSIIDQRRCHCLVRILCRHMSGPRSFGFCWRTGIVWATGKGRLCAFA